MMEEDEGDMMHERPRYESNERISVEVGRLHWTSGSCNEQGRYKHQEDRCVHYCNVVKEFEGREIDGSIGVFEPLPTCPPTLQSSMSTGSSLGYFGVFDGHAGMEGSSFVSQNLHLEIMRYPCNDYIFGFLIIKCLLVGMHALILILTRLFTLAVSQPMKLFLYVVEMFFPFKCAYPIILCYRDRTFVILIRNYIVEQQQSVHLYEIKN